MTASTILGVCGLCTIGLRIVWQMRPGPTTCAMFWIAASAVEVYRMAQLAPRYRLPEVIMMIGLLLNGAVTIANGGLMPTTENHTGSLWVRAEESQGRLLWLGDNYGGFSIGDMFIGVSLLAILVIWTISKARERARVLA